MDHQAEAYVAPRRVMAEANGNAPKKPAVALTANGKPKWGGAEVCPRCDKSVNIFRSIVFHIRGTKLERTSRYGRLRRNLIILWVSKVLKPAVVLTANGEPKWV